MIPVTTTSKPALVHTPLPISMWRTGFLNSLFNDDQFRTAERLYVNNVFRSIWNEKTGDNFMVLAGADTNKRSSQDGRLIGQESNLALS